MSSNYIPPQPQAPVSAGEAPMQVGRVPTRSRSKRVRSNHQTGILKATTIRNRQKGILRVIATRSRIGLPLTTLITNLLTLLQGTLPTPQRRGILSLSGISSPFFRWPFCLCSCLLVWCSVVWLCQRSRRLVNVVRLWPLLLFACLVSSLCFWYWCFLSGHFSGR